VNYRGVQNGTPFGPRLCDRCRMAQIMRGDGLQDNVYCRSTAQHVRLRVVECNSFDDKSRPSLWDMTQMAWVLATSSGGRVIGFVSAKEFRNKHGEDPIMPGYPPPPGP